MTYKEILHQAKTVINSKIVDYRPAFGLYMDGIDDCVKIPNAITCWLDNGDSVVYIAKEREND